MGRLPDRYAPDPRARWIWIFAIAVAGALAWLLDDSAQRAGARDEAPPDTSLDPVEEVDVVWVPSAEPPPADAGARPSE